MPVRSTARPHGVSTPREQMSPEMGAAYNREMARINAAPTSTSHTLTPEQTTHAARIGVSAVEYAAAIAPRPASTRAPVAATHPGAQRSWKAGGSWRSFVMPTLSTRLDGSCVVV